MGGFGFIDKIAEFKRGESLVAFFKLKGDEEFLQDHFDGFAVMPGVLILESLKQASSYLLAMSCDFKEPFYRLVRAGNIRFGQFVKPGSQLQVSACLAQTEPGGSAKVNGRIDLVAGDGRLSRVLLAQLELVPVQVSQEKKESLKIIARKIFEGIR